MNEQLFKKQGRKYVKVGYSDGSVDFPCEGIWIVYSKPGCKTHSCIAQVGKFEDINYPSYAALLKAKEDDCLKALNKLINKAPYSHSDIVKTIFKTICSNEEVKKT